MTPDPPTPSGSHLYHYGGTEPHRLKWLKPLLLQHELYVPLVTELNDLREARPRVKIVPGSVVADFLKEHYLKLAPTLTPEEIDSVTASLHQAAALLTREQIASEIAKILYASFSNLRLYSMSKRWDNLSMWMWYGGRYTGYCLEFDWRSFPHAREVIYTDDLEIDITDPSHRNANWFFYKSADWSNEEEVRSGASQAIEPFNPRALTRVVLGKDIPTDREEQIRKWAVQRDPPVAVVNTMWKEFQSRLVIV